MYSFSKLVSIANTQPDRESVGAENLLGQFSSYKEFMEFYGLL